MTKYMDKYMGSVLQGLFTLAVGAIGIVTLPFTIPLFVIGRISQKAFGVWFE
jgi:hypothetical protein